ncbi:hypothetical protein NMG60_11004884 [Bertholletia excelsa]
MSLRRVIRTPDNFVLHCSNMAANTTVAEAFQACSPASPCRQRGARERSVPPRISLRIPILFRTITSPKSSVRVRASEPQKDRVNSSADDPDRAFTSQEDLSYLWKLGAGSVVGAAAIKYGSILFPQITRPNILEAMIIIITPVIIAVLLLIRQSRI